MKVCRSILLLPVYDSLPRYARGTTIPGKDCLLAVC